MGFIQKKSQAYIEKLRIYRSKHKIKRISSIVN